MSLNEKKKKTTLKINIAFILGIDINVMGNSFQYFNLILLFLGYNKFKLTLDMNWNEVGHQQTVLYTLA